MVTSVSSAPPLAGPALHSQAVRPGLRVDSAFPRLPLTWELTAHPDRKPAPASGWIPAQVPGAVQLDWARAHGWPDFWKADHFRDYAWMEDSYWTYRTRLDFPALEEGQQLFFRGLGIDYRFEIYLGSRCLHEQEGMFAPFAIDLTGHARPGDELRILVFPAPKSRATPVDRSQANRSCKPGVSYGWDFHPRLIPLGIWDDAWLEIRPAAVLTQIEIDYQLNEDFSEAVVQLDFACTAGAEGSVRWTLTDPQGGVCFVRETPLAPNPHRCTASLSHPQLWWPHDQGEPALYTTTVELLSPAGQPIQTATRRLGLRRVRLVMNEGAWAKPDSFPKGRSVPPITLEINGRRIFAKGSNWVNPHIFPGAIDAETYRPLLARARAANMNILRCWGGAIVNKESFFDQCDELGLMVWQEFPLACNLYPDDEAYLRVLDAESRAIIHRLKPHPCVVLWCGGNELFNAWSEMTDQALPLRLLNRNCFDLDPSRPFLPTAPIMGMAHGHYVFRDPETGDEAWALFQKSAASAYTEFGCPGAAPVEVLQDFLPPGELFPPRHGTAWETHHAFGVWMAASHLYVEVIEHYCGPSSTLEEMVAHSQYLQAEGYKGLFEEARRQKPVAAMALNWCLNEPWPCAANNSLISWPCVPKPALEAVAASCRPALASARIRQFAWQAGDLFDPEIWLLSDSPQPLAAGTMEAWVETPDEKFQVLIWPFPCIPANANLGGPRVQFRLPEWSVERFVLHLRVPGRPELDSAYCLVYRPAKPAAESVTTTRTMNL